MSATLPFAAPPISTPSHPLLRRLGPLALVLLLHGGFFYALQRGALPPPAPIAQKEVLVQLIAPAVAPKPAPLPEPAPPAAAPKPTPKVLPARKQAPKPPPVSAPTPTPAPLSAPAPTPAPAVQPAPAEQAIAPPAPPESAAPASATPAAPAVAPAATSVAASAASAVPKTIVSGVEYLQAPQPEYPLLSRRKGEEGKVVLRALINLKGRPDQVEIQSSSGSARLDEAARQAVLRAVFKPHLEDGKPVMVYAIVPIKFQLDR